MSLLVIGDVHGKTDAYWKLLQKHKPERSICVGDFGFQREHDWHLKNIDGSRHKILFGNHDYYPYLDKPHSLGDFEAMALDDGRELCCIRGAYSIDKLYRTRGRDWFAEEEMTYTEWQKVIACYDHCRPDVVISHDCPQSVKEQLFGYYDRTITGQGLQACLDIHRPSLWIFGHHHKSRREQVGDTLFVCLNELETFAI